MLELSDLAAGFTQTLTLGVLIAVPIGVVLGMIMGTIPGIGGSTMLALALPSALFLPPLTGMALLLSMYAANAWGAAVTAILLNIPGSGGATATAVDGYALTKQGRAGEALAVGRSAGFIGGVVGAAALLLLAPIIASWALRFGPAEYFALAIFGVTIVAAVSGKSLLKGLIGACLGFLLATVGTDPFTGIERYVLGLTDLREGVHLVWVIVGLFAVAQSLEIMSGREQPLRYTGHIEVPWRKAWPIMWAKRRITFAATLTGVLIGTIPGAGSTIAAWIAYNQAQRLSKEPEKFGEGSLDGVIGPEAANDSVDGGSLVPLMTLGIPGSASAAILLGGMVVAGMRPGPQLFSEQAPQAVSMMMLYMLANVALFALAVASMRLLVGILRIDPRVWPCLIMVFGIFGAFMIDRSLFGPAVALLLGLLGYGLRVMRFPLPPLLLGFILGPILEYNLRRTLIISRGELVSYLAGRPIVLALFGIALAAVIADLTRKLRARRPAAESGREPADEPAQRS